MDCEEKTSAVDKCRVMAGDFFCSAASSCLGFYAWTEPYSLFCRFSRYGLRCRPQTSDLNVFTQIFISREYRCLDEVQEPALIFYRLWRQNVGYSSAYFLSRFPKARLIAIGPDPNNFVMLLKNIRLFGSRAAAICSGVWSREVGLVISEEPFGPTVANGHELSAPRERRRKARNDGDGHRNVVEEFGLEQISNSKVDIEGAEAEVFDRITNHGFKVNNIVIVRTRHGRKCEEIFGNAIAKEDFSSRALRRTRRMQQTCMTELLQRKRIGALFNRGLMDDHRKAQPRDESVK